MECTPPPHTCFNSVSIHRRITFFPISLTLLRLRLRLHLRLLQSWMSSAVPVRSSALTTAIGQRLIQIREEIAKTSQQKGKKPVRTQRIDTDRQRSEKWVERRNLLFIFIRLSFLSFLPASSRLCFQDKVCRFDSSSLLGTNSTTTTRFRRKLCQGIVGKGGFEGVESRCQ